MFQIQKNSLHSIINSCNQWLLCYLLYERYRLWNLQVVFFKPYVVLRKMPCQAYCDATVFQNTYNISRFCQFVILFKPK